MASDADVAALAARIEALEAQVAYQDKTVDELNQTITAQWTEIDGLTRRLRQLADRLQEAEARAAVTPGEEPPPPHY